MGVTALTELFKTSVPDGFLPALAERVPWVYKTAHARSNKMPEEQACNLVPFYRWCLLDAELAATGRQLGMEVKTIKNDGHCYFVQVGSGRILLTASSVENPYKPPRKALFRNTLARDSVVPLFHDLHDPPPDDASLYAILIHAPDPENRRVPLFANIRFPLPDCRAWAPGKISLLESYPTLASAKKSFAEERIEDQVLTELRGDAQKNASKREKG